jgi:hypothetical protein
MAMGGEVTERYNIIKRSTSKKNILLNEAVKKQRWKNSKT